MGMDYRLLALGEKTGHRSIIYGATLLSFVTWRLWQTIPACAASYSDDPEWARYV